MADITVLAGDFPTGTFFYLFGSIDFPKKPKKGFPEPISIKPKQDLLHIEIVSQETESQVSKAAKSGIVGGLLLGGTGVVIANSTDDRNRSTAKWQKK